MSTISAGTTSTNALVNTGDTTGNLVFQTNGTTTAMTIDTSGNVNISRTGARITGDFSNATIANRVAFQTSTVNGNTAVIALPNGTSAVSAFRAFNNSDPTNASFIDIAAVGGVDARVSSGITGTGTYLPMTFYTNGSEQMRIDSSGNVAVGTSNTSFGKFTLVCSGTSRTTGLSITPSGDLSDGLRLYCDNTNNPNGVIENVWDSSGSILYRNILLNPNGGEVYIAGTTDQGAYNLQVNGTGVWAAGAYVNGSDARLKENIQTLSDGLSVVSQLRPVTFQYKADYSKDTSIQPGFIAQELQAALQGKDYVDGVVQAGPEYLNVAYQSLIPVLVKAIQEQQAMITQLQAEVAALKGAQ